METFACSIDETCNFSSAFQRVSTENYKGGGFTIYPIPPAGRSYQGGLFSKSTPVEICIKFPGELCLRWVIFLFNLIPQEAPGAQEGGYRK